MSNLLIISIMESLYLIYMFLFFRTSVDFNFLPPGLLARNSDWFKHLLGNECGLRICPFGRVVIFLLIAIILARNFISIPKKYIISAFVISALLSLMNMNAVAYMMPVWILEASHIR